MQIIHTSKISSRSTIKWKHHNNPYQIFWLYTEILISRSFIICITKLVTYITVKNNLWSILHDCLPLFGLIWIILELFSQFLWLWGKLYSQKCSTVFYKYFILKYFYFEERFRIKKFYGKLANYDLFFYFLNRLIPFFLLFSCHLRHRVQTTD